jgi:hypothetical protein
MRSQVEAMMTFQQRLGQLEDCVLLIVVTHDLLLLVLMLEDDVLMVNGLAMIVSG